MEVIETKQDVLVEEILLHTAVIGTCQLRANGADVIGGYGLLPTILVQEVIERTELLQQRRLLIALGIIEGHAGSVKDALARLDEVIGRAHARRADGSVEIVFLNCAAGRVEEAVVQLAVQLAVVVVVGALELVVEEVGLRILRATLIFKAKAAGEHQCRAEGVVGLRVEIVAQIGVVNHIGIDAVIGRRVVHDGLSGDRVAVRAANRDDIAVVVPAFVVGRQIACRVKDLRLLALAHKTIAHQAGPGAVEGVGQRAREKSILIGLFAVVREAKEGIRAGQIGRAVDLVDDDAQAGVGAEVIAKIRDGGDEVILIVRDGVLRLQVAEGPVIVKIVAHAAQLHLVAVSAEVAAVALVEQAGKGRAALWRRESNDPGGGIGAVEHAVRAAIGLDMIDARGGEHGIVKLAPDVFNGHAVEDDTIGVGVAAVNED